MAMEPPTRHPRRSARRRTGLSVRCGPIEPAHVVPGQYIGYRDEPAAHDSETDVHRAASDDNWRWAERSVLPAHGQANSEGASDCVPGTFSKSMFPGSGISTDPTTTFDLAGVEVWRFPLLSPATRARHEARQVGLQFALHKPVVSVMCSRPTNVSCIHGAMSGDHVFTTAEGIGCGSCHRFAHSFHHHRCAYAPGSWGPNAIHQLIAPHAWRLPFERAWRTTPA